MSGGFKRSGLFGILGVIVVAALIAVIATSTGEGQSDPKTTYALIFGVIAVFLVILFVLQRGDLNRASGADARETSRGAAEGGRRVENPTTLGDAELWAAMAVEPIDRDAIEARTAMWGAARSSQSLAMVVTLLILLTVPPIYFLESFVPLLIGGPLIVVAALWGSVKALMPGGDLDKGYDNVSRAMAPLARFEATSRKLTVSSGPDGIVIARGRGGQADWLCDLWLAERLAEC